MLKMDRAHVVEPEEMPAGGYINALFHAQPPAYERFEPGLRAARARAQVIQLAELHPLDADETPVDTTRALLTHKGGALKVWNREIAGHQHPYPALGIANRLLLDPSTAATFLARLHDRDNPLSAAVLRSHGFPDPAIDSIHRGNLTHALDLRASYLGLLEARAIADAFGAWFKMPDSFDAL